MHPVSRMDSHVQMLCMLARTCFVVCCAAANHDKQQMQAKWTLLSMGMPSGTTYMAAAGMKYHLEQHRNSAAGASDH